MLPGINKELLQKIEESLDILRPYLQEDGGDIEVVEMTSDNVIKVRLTGNCKSCPISFITLKGGIEETLKRAIPEIKGIEAVNVNIA